MKRFLPLYLLLAAACNQPVAAGAAAGKALFNQSGCASCHKVGDMGSAVGPDLTMVGLRHSPEWLELYIKDPQAWKKDTLMPNRRMSDEARKAIVEYLSMLKGQDWGEGERPWDKPSLIKNPVARGRVLYNRAGCAGCHGIDAVGGYPNNNVKGGLIPPLNKAVEGFTKAELIKKIKAGVPEPQRDDPKGPAPMIRMPAWGEALDESELDAVASYLLSLASGEKADF